MHTYTRTHVHAYTHAYTHAKLKCARLVSVRVWCGVCVCVRAGNTASRSENTVSNHSKSSPPSPACWYHGLSDQGLPSQKDAASIFNLRRDFQSLSQLRCTLQRYTVHGTTRQRFIIAAASSQPCLSCAQKRAVHRHWGRLHTARTPHTYPIHRTHTQSPHTSHTHFHLVDGSTHVHTHTHTRKPNGFARN